MAEGDRRFQEPRDEWLRRQRRVRIAALGGAAAVLIVASVGIVVHNGVDNANGRARVHTGGSVSTTSGETPTNGETTSVSTTSGPPKTSGETTTTGPTTNAGGGAGSKPQGNAPTKRPSSPWQVSATSGLTNLAPVTIRAAGIPSGTYYVGQCPAGQAPSVNACVLNNVVTVSDGTINSTVRVFWWLQNGQIDCGHAPGACVVGVRNARTATTVVTFPISFDPTRQPTITVTPHDSLADGQSLVVDGVNVGAGTMQVSECLLPQWASCTDVEVQSQPDGTFITPMTVHRELQWDGHGPGSGTCGVDGDCVIEVWMIPTGLASYRIWINPEQPVTLSFAPAAP